MERTESTVVSVAPDSENEVIRQMGLFGWNLHGRQEIIGPLREAPPPNSLIGAMVRGATEGAKGKLYVRDHYVKLHFVRPLNLPNLDKLRQIEAEFANLPYPEAPGLGWPIGLTAMFALGTIIGIPEMPVLSRITYAALTLLCGYWVSRRLRKREEARTIYQQSVARREELLEKARYYLERLDSPLDGA